MVATKKKPRLNLELDHPTKDRLDRLQKLTEANSMTEVIRRALRLYEILTVHQNLGGQVLLKKDGGSAEVIFL